MAGFAATWELNFAGPWGTVAWVVTGAALTIAGAVAIEKVEDRSRSQDQTRAVPQSITKNPECQDCKRYGVRIQAQGIDCGGRTSSTIGAPGISQSSPVTVAQGLALSAATQAMLTKGQLKIRLGAIAKAHNYITTGPENGGRFGLKSFPVLGVRGGIRYDVDCFGDGNSFVS